MVFLYTAAKNINDIISEATSAIGNANQTFVTDPVRDKRYAAGSRTRS